MNSTFKRPFIYSKSYTVISVVLCVLISALFLAWSTNALDALAIQPATSTKSDQSPRYTFSFELHTTDDGTLTEIHCHLVKVEHGLLEECKTEYQQIINAIVDELLQHYDGSRVAFKDDLTFTIIFSTQIIS